MPLPSDFAARYEAKRQALTDARMVIVALEAEVRTYDEIAALLEGSRATRRPAEPAPKPRTVSAARSLRKKPKAMIRALAALYPQVHTLSSLADAMGQAGHSIKPGTLRSSISVYVKRGFVERVAPGVYRVTQAGAAAAGVDLGK